MSSPKKTQKIFYNFFSSKRAVFAVFLAVLVLGFWVNVSFAGPTILAPGTKITPEFQQLIDNHKVTGAITYLADTGMKNLVASGSMPTSPGDWGAVLKYYGGNTQDEINKAGIQYANLFTPTTNRGITAAIANTLGITDSDSTMLDKWKNGQNVEAKSPATKAVATAMLPAASAEQATYSWLASKVWDVVIGVLSIIAYFCKELLSYAAQLLDLTLDPNLYNFTSNKMIVQGWTMVRDVCNLFFLLVLLFIALCTILKIEKYHAKKTLLTLIIMALLINFSKPIAIFIFDGSQLLMNMFLRQMGQTGTGTSASTVITQATEIAKIVYNSLPTQGAGSAVIAVQYLFAVVFLFMLAVAYLVTGIMLLVRIIAIMMLIIVSPLAFFAAIIPDFSKMSSQWWSSLFEYSYYGPAAAFFLLLATNLSDALPYVTKDNGIGQTMAITVGNILHYLTVLIFLYASIIMAKKFGGGAGAAIVGNANRFMEWGAGMTKGGGMWGAGARGVAWGGRTTGISGGVGQMIGASRFGKYLTKKGKEASQKDREAGVAEALGVKGAKEAREKQKVAEQREQWKKEGKTEGDFKKSLRSSDPIERKAAALELVKQGKVKDDETYELVLDSLKGSHATVGDAIAKDHDEVKDAIKEVGKKRIDLVANEEAKRTGVDKLIVGENLMSKANPDTIKDWDIKKITGDTKLTDALKKTYMKYGGKPKIQEKILENMSAEKIAAGESKSIW